MSSTAEVDGGSAEDQAYFRALEERFLALRGRATLLAADDWSAARDWRRLGIPLELVVGVMEDLFARQRARRPKRGISSLRYFRAAVEAAWEERLELAAGGSRAAADPGPPLEARLAALAAALPPGLPGGAELGARILALPGAFEEVEAALAELDRAAIGALRATLGADEQASVRSRAERALAAAMAAAPADELAQARERLEAQVVRQRFGLPVLSLFAPAALGPLPE